MRLIVTTTFVPAAAGFCICIWVLSRRLFLQRSASYLLASCRCWNRLIFAASSSCNHDRENSRNLLCCVFDIAACFTACCHALCERRTCSLQSPLCECLQFSQFSLFGIELARSAGKSVSTVEAEKIVDERYTKKDSLERARSHVSCRRVMLLTFALVLPTTGPS